MFSIKKMLRNFYHFLLAWATYWRYGRPARQLIVIGVTGTKGKSTTCRLIASVLEAGGYKVGLMTTVEFQIGEKRWMNDKKMTMLGRGEIQKMLKDMVAAGCRYVVVETSSEGIMQFRHYGLQYDIVVFTNLGTEHSERHGGFENLRRDKGRMFAALRHYPHKIIAGQKISKVIVANTDDEQAGFFLNFPADEKYVFGVQQKELPRMVAPVWGEVSAADENGVLFVVGRTRYRLNITGEFNMYNALAAVAVGQSQGIANNQIAKGLAGVSVVPGRMEFIDMGQPFKAIVDYAHEPLSLTALFTTLRKMTQKNNGRVIAVIGSDGGGRDIKKRGRMGEIAGRLCDYVVVSDVNCFDEDPSAIAEMLAAGARRAGKKDGQDMFIIVDRRQGFVKAVSLARPGDVVVVTAKGTEPVICGANGSRMPWDDRKVLKEVLAQPKVC